MCACVVDILRLPWQANMDLGIEVSILKKQVEMPLAQIWSDMT